MKKFKFLSFFCLALFMLTSCSTNNASRKLAKSWAVDNIETSTPVGDSAKAQLLSGSEMAFTTDGHYRVVGGIGADEGTYTVDKDAKNLTTVSDLGNSNSNYEIRLLTDDSLVLNTNGNILSLTSKK